MIGFVFVSLWALHEAFSCCCLDARLFTCHNSDCSEGPKEEEAKDKSEEEQVKIIAKILLDLHKHARR